MLKLESQFKHCYTGKKRLGGGIWKNSGVTYPVWCGGWGPEGNSFPPVCPEDLRTTKEDLEGTPHQDCDETTPDVKTEVGTSQGCHPRHGEIQNAQSPMLEKPRGSCARVYEHKRAMRMSDFNVSESWKCMDAGHSLDWNGVTVLDQH